MKRRTFFKLAGAATAGALVPYDGWFASAPLYGDTTQFGMAMRYTDFALDQSHGQVFVHMLGTMCAEIKHHLDARKFQYIEKSAQVYHKFLGSSGTIDPCNQMGALGLKVLGYRRPYPDNWLVDIDAEEAFDELLRLHSDPSVHTGTRALT